MDSRKQNLGVAYASKTKRKTEEMAHGGLIEDDNTPEDELKEIDDLSVEDKGHQDKEDEHFAKGGVVERIMNRRNPELEQAELPAEEPSDEELLKELYADKPAEEDMKRKSTVDKIMHKRRK